MLKSQSARRPNEENHSSTIALEDSIGQAQAGMRKHDTEKPPSRRMRCYMDIGDLKDAWALHCKASGTTSSEGVRTIIRLLLEKDRKLQTVRGRYTLGEAIDFGKRVRVELLLTPSESAAISEEAGSGGITRQTWIINCARNALTGERMFNAEQVKALWDSNYQLGMIGRNLNQIAKRLNDLDTKSERLKLVFIGDIRDSIADHTELVSKLVSTSVDRRVVEAK